MNCGTNAGYYRHRRRGERACDACRTAHSEHRRQLGQNMYGAKHGKFIQVPLDWAKCGTAAQYRAHLRRGETPCGACRRAESRRRIDARTRKAVA